MSNKEWKQRVFTELNALEDLIDECNNEQFEDFANRLGALFVAKGMAVDDVESARADEILEDMVDSQNWKEERQALIREYENSV